MRFTRKLMMSALLGASAMYFFDPQMGRRRRALIEDQLRRLGRNTTRGIETGLRDLQNRGQGLMHDAEALLHVGVHKNGIVSKRGRLKFSPGPRLLVAAGGTALMANCALRRTAAAAVLGTLGFSAFLKAIGCRQEVPVQRTVKISAPVDQVFEFFANPENYSRISDMITDVALLGRARFAKTMLVGGVPVRFEERFICREKNRRIETEATEASPIHFTKQLFFEPLDEHTTRLRLNFCYSPPGGDFGHGIAALLGVDAQTLLGDLLMRAKSFLETGRQPHDSMRAHRPLVYQHNGRQTPERMRGSGAPESDRGSIGLSNSRAMPWPRSEQTMSGNIPVPERFPPVVD